MRYLMYETAEFSISTGGTTRFREMYYYFNSKNSVDMYSQSNVFTDCKNVYNLNTKYIKKYPYFRFEKTKITFHNKVEIKSINNKKYDKVFVFDVPAHIGLALLGVRRICLMVRKDLLDYKKLSLESKNASRLLIVFWMIYLNMCEAICLLNAEDVIVQCEYDKEKIIRRHPFIRKTVLSKIKVQINNVNPSWIVENSEQYIEYDRYKIDEGKNNICCICGFGDKRKGADIILSAFADLYNKDDNVCLHMIGDGKLLSGYVEKYKDHKNIVFWGRMSNPTYILRQSTMAVVPSRADSCPNTVMEALYNGIPVIGAKSGGIPEILCDDNALFDVNVNALKSLLVKMQDKNYLNKVLEYQKNRKNELMFDWVKRIEEIIR